LSIHPDTQAALIKGKDELFAKHGKDPNFTGCGVGFRRRGGKVTQEPAIIAFVEHKLPAGAVSSRLMLPGTVMVDGVNYGVDVVEAGPVYASSGKSEITLDAIETTGPINEQYRPIVQGCGIQNVNDVATNLGTLGCFVVDNTDKTICLLSANHVIARFSSAAGGEVIIQPAAADGGTSSDGIAKFKRYVGISDVDAAIAQLTDQSGSSYSLAFAYGLVQPISATHPAVGMCVANDSSYNSFLSRMDSTLSELDVTIATIPGNAPATAAPVVGMNIEKVGRTSGYTSAPIDAVAVTLNANFDGNMINMTNLIWSQWFHMEGDSGAIACQGGPGNIYVEPSIDSCVILSAFENYYAIPATNGNAITNAVQDQFLSQSLGGLLAINLIYMNGQLITSRLSSHTGTAYNQATAQAYALEYYNRYYDAVITALENPDATTPVVTNQMFEDYYTFWTFLTTAASSGGAGGILTTEEADAAYAFMLTLGGLIGYTYQQLITFFNQKAECDNLYQLAVSTGTLLTP
jgi:hypothetical protein